jgi:hypothetical protein
MVTLLAVEWTQQKTTLLVKDIVGRNALILSGHEPESFLEVDGSVGFADLSYLFEKYARMLFHLSKAHRNQRTEEIWLEAADLLWCKLNMNC